MATKPLPVHGVDISHHQDGRLDLPGAKRRGLRWLYHKATEGDAFIDANYARRRAEARAAGLPFGAYHFARADRGDARQEARFFLSVAKPLPGDLRPALDLETQEGMSLAEIRVWAKEFIDEVEQRTGHKPVVYTPFDLGSVDDGCVIWRPRYNSSNTPPALAWDVFQFSNGVLGVPNRLEGIGNVDLNYMRDGLATRAMQIPVPKEPKPEPASSNIRFAHCSMQFSDSRTAMFADTEKLFARFVKKGTEVVTGTEASNQNIREALAAAAKKHGYRLHIVRSCWVAVRKDFIKGNWDQGYIHVLDAGTSKTGKHTDRGIVWVAFDTEAYGRVNVGSSHYLTKGRPNAKGEYAANVEANRRLAHAIGAWARQAGRGRALVFYGGDQNIVDRTEDTFFGAPLTSAWDELGKYENTGHGNIDVLASFDGDGRVEADWIEALDDSEFALHTDHFLVEGAFKVKHAA